MTVKRGDVWQAVVIGGGVTGLATCNRLIAESHKRDIPLDVKLLEASDRVGGVVRTSNQDGFIVEHGPDAFISTKPWAKALCEELGIGDRLIGTNPKQRRSFILHKGVLHPVPEGFYMMAPASFLPFVKSPIFTWRGKLRMAMDFCMPRRRDGQEESVEHFVKRRLGTEAFTRIAQPMIGGVYTGDAKHLSLKATLPQFLEMEQEYGSIIKALIGRKKQSKAEISGTSGPRYSLFLSLESGMQTLIDALVERLPVDSIQLAAEVNRIEQLVSRDGWCIHLNNQENINADLVCIALPAPRAATLIKTVVPELTDLLASIPYVSSAAVNLAFHRKEIEHPLNGTGFVVPAIEGRSILGCTFSSVKFAGRAPADGVLLRAFLGGALQPNYFLQSESEMVESVLKNLRDLLGINGEPTLAVVSKHNDAMAQYHVGHLDKAAEIKAQLKKLPGLALAGNAYQGIGIPDCIHSGEKAAYALLDYLTTDYIREVVTLNSRSFH